MKHISCIVIVAIIVIASKAFCCTWVESVGEVVADTFTPAEAKNLALKKARLTAIEQAVGVQIAGSTLVKDSAFVGEYINSLARGYVSEEKVILWEQDKYQTSPQSPPTPILKVKLKACVEALPINRSDEFKISADLNKAIFIEGEKAHITVSSNTKAYINIFNLTAEERVVFFHQPPQFTMPILIDAEQKSIQFPGKGASLEMVLPDGFSSATEAFIIVATKEKVDFPLVFKGKLDLSLAEFYKGIAKVNGTITQDMILYRVEKRAE